MQSLAEFQATVSLLTQRLQSRSNILWRFSIRLLSTFLIVVGLGLHIGAIVQPARSRSIPSGSSTYTYDERPWFSPEGLTFLTAALVWNIAEFITLKVRGRGIHPGAHVAIDLQLWMGLLASGVVELIIDFWNGVAVAAGTIKVFCGILHFTLFVFACIDTDRRRKLDKARFIVEITTAAAAATTATNNSLLYTTSNNDTPRGFPIIPPGIALVPIEMLRLDTYRGKVYISSAEVRYEEVGMGMGMGNGGGRSRG